MSKMSDVNNVKYQQCQMSIMLKCQNVRCKKICQDLLRYVKMSKCQSNYQNVNQIVKMSIKLSKCQSNCQNVNLIVKM